MVLIGSKKKTRRYHLGVDYGTAWSKLILRDMEAKAGVPEARVLVFEDSYRLPSLVALHNGALWFGHLAEKRRGRPGVQLFPSVKMRMVEKALKGKASHNGKFFFAKEASLPHGMDEEDLAVLSVLYLLQMGKRKADEAGRKVDADARLGMTLGVPMTPRCFSSVEQDFARVAARAFELLKERRVPDLSVGSLPTQDAHRYVSMGKASVVGADEVPMWVRSEAGAALHWAVASPSLRPGLYAIVDIGAGTTSTSVFRIVAKHGIKELIAVFGASCGPPGMDRIDALLATLLSEPDGTVLRGAERLHAGLIDKDPLFRDVLDEMNSNRRMAFKEAYTKDGRTSEWRTEKFEGIILIGGGNRLPPLIERSRGFVWPWSRAPFKVIPIPWPKDLEVLASGREDLLVAHGLSIPSAGVFRVEDPESIEPIDLARFPDTWLDRDTLYAK